MDGLRQIYNALVEFFSAFIKEAPFTLAVLLILFAIYYVAKVHLVRKYISSQKQDDLPIIIGWYFYKKTSGWDLIRTFFQLVQFLVVLFLLYFILKWIGFKVPAGF